MMEKPVADRCAIVRTGLGIVLAIGPLGTLPSGAVEPDGRSVAAIQQRLADDPRNASAWAQLGDALSADGKRIPAFLAYARHLTFDPSAPDSAAIAKRLSELLFQNIRQGDAGKTTITMSPDTDDPWWSINLLVSSVAANRHSGAAATMSDGEFFVAAFDGVTLFASEQ